MNFVSGGPVRVLMHILLNSLVLLTHKEQLFNNAVESLRYLMLRERGDFFNLTITKIFGDKVSAQSLQVYTLFNRASFFREIRQMNK